MDLLLDSFIDPPTSFILLRRLIDKEGMPEDWLVVTTATNPRASLTALGAHLSYFGYKYYVGRYGSIWNGFKDKLRVEEETARVVNPDTMLVFVDAYDICVNASLDDLKKQYAQVAKNGEIVMQHDMNCHPDKSLAPFLRERMPGIKSPFPNAGCIIGPAKSFVKIFDAFPIAGFNDD